MVESEHRHITWNPDDADDVIRSDVEIRNARAAGFYIIQEGPGQVLATMDGGIEVPDTSNPKGNPKDDFVKAPPAPTIEITEEEVVNEVADAEASEEQFSSFQTGKESE
jgi:hypothetical protein